MAKQETQQEAARNAKKRLVETLAAKHRLEMKLTDLRQDSVKWRERESLAEKAGDLVLKAAAADRAMKADSALESTRRDLDSLDVDIVRLRNDVRAPHSPASVPAVALDTSVSQSMSEGPTTPNSSREPDWDTLLRSDVDQEIADIRQRMASPRTNVQPGDSKET